MAGTGERHWRCLVCGYLHHGPAPPEYCPVCGAPASKFESYHEVPSSPPLETTDPGLTWSRVAAPDDMLDNTVKKVQIGARTLALVRRGERFYALDHACPHQGGPLGEGTVVNGNLRCPWHGWTFDPASGRSIVGDKGVETFPCDVRADGVFVGIKPETRPIRTISDLMVETMINWGVKYVFGMIGHSNLGLADAIRRQQERGTLTYIGVRHEGAAAFAASAYGKLTGKPAACLSIAGPGATNMLTGLWDARMDRIPILALTGQVDTQVLGPGAFQEVNLAAAFNSVSAWSQTVLHSSNHTELMNLALKNAILKRDVAHLIFPNEIQSLPVPEDAVPGTPEGRIPSREIRPPEDAMKSALDLLRRAARPVIIVGHGARFQMGPVMQLAQQINCPVITTFKGKGLIPDEHPLACGVLGRSGTLIASHFMQESDLLLVFGASFSHHTGITPNKPTIQVDYDPVILGKFHAVTVPVYGEIGITARSLLNGLSDQQKEKWHDHREEIAERWRTWREEKTRRASERPPGRLNSADVFAALSRTTPADAVIAVDVGNNTYSFGRYFECKNQSILMSGYLGSIGFGYPAAMGAWAAAPNRPIVALTGDGGFGQYMGELCTAVKYDMNITHVLINNDELGKISMEQRASQLPVWETSLHNPNFAHYAEICGAMGIRVVDPDALDDALRQAFDHAGPVLVEIVADPELI